MSRYIDADALIMALRLEYPMMPMFKENQKEWEIKTDGYLKAEEVIKNAPTIDIPQWIPCSERLPKENEEVLVCDADGTMEVCDLEMFGRGIGLKWTDKNGYECWLDVIAWMPLPKPYGEREGE